MNANNSGKYIKSKDRIQKHGEVFTPAWLVNDMLALLPDDVWRPEKTFLEPACGEVAFLVEIYKRKLEKISTAFNNRSEWEWQAAIATSSIYGIELLEDNAEQCALNLLQIFTKFYNEIFPDTQNDEVVETIQFLISRNIIQGNALSYRRCKLSCGNDCKTCEPIIFSEWTPDENSQFRRKDFAYESMVNADKMRRSSKNLLFDGIFSTEEYGLVKKYKSVNYKQIRYAKD